MKEEEKEIKNITIDELARMMNASFEDIKQNLGGKIDNVAHELHEFKIETGESFDKVDERLEHIENIMIRDDRKRIERIEDKLLKVEVILGKRL